MELHAQVCDDVKLMTQHEIIVSDVNECETIPDICDHICVDTVGSYHCECDSGYRLNAHTNNTCDGMSYY